MNLVLVGPPGAGKGTQAARLWEQYGIARVSTGEMLRAAAERGGEAGRQIAAWIDRGDLVPDEMVQNMVWERLSEPDMRDGFLLDGFPRTVAQAEALEHFLREHQRELTAVLDLEVEEEELIRRLAGRRICPVCGANYHLALHPPHRPGRCDVDGTLLQQRPDDRPEAIRERLRLYHQRTRPVIDYYRDRGLLRVIDGGRELDEVFAQIRQALGEPAAFTRTAAAGEPALWEAEPGPVGRPARDRI